MEKLLTVGEVAEILGISKFGVYGLVFKKKIPAVKISRRLLRFSPKAIEIFLTSKSQGIQEGIVPRTTIRRGRPKKNGAVSGEYVNRLVEHAKKEVLK